MWEYSFFSPSLLTKATDNALGGSLGWAKNLIEGLIKIVIFIAYLWLVSLMPDIRRTFEYHGAEHKSIFCYEAGVELTPANAAKYKRFSPALRHELYVRNDSDINPH